MATSAGLFDPIVRPSAAVKRCTPVGPGQHSPCSCGTASSRGRAGRYDRRQKKTRGHLAGSKKYRVPGLDRRCIDRRRCGPYPRASTAGGCGARAFLPRVTVFVCRRHRAPFRQGECRAGFEGVSAISVHPDGEHKLSCLAQSGVAMIASQYSALYLYFILGPFSQLLFRGRRELRSCVSVVLVSASSSPQDWPSWPLGPKLALPS